MGIRILDRYLARAILLQTLSAVTVLCMVLVIGNLLRELLPLIICQHLPITLAFGFMAEAIPFTLPYIVPWSLLVSIQLTFGRISADNELTAISASGVSTPRFCLPAFQIAVVLSLMCLWINCHWAPRAQVRMLDSIVNLALEKPSYLFQDNQTVDLFSDRKVFVESVDGNRLKNIQIFEISKEGGLNRVVSAKEAIVTRAKEVGCFLLQFKNTRIEERPPSDSSDPMKIRQGIYLSEGTYILPVGKATGADYQKNALSAKTHQQLQKEAADTTNPRQHKARLEIHRRFSLALACVTFALVGIPLAVTTRRRETSAGFAISLLLAFYYYFFIVAAQSLASYPILSLALIWSPNIVFVLTGLFLFQRLCK